MNKVWQQEGGDVFFIIRGGQFHMMDLEGLTTSHVAKQQEVEINIKRGEPRIQIDTKIHLMERLVMTIDTKPSRGHVWTPSENDVFRYQNTFAPST
jgi:hypothetical protein